MAHIHYAIDFTTEVYIVYKNRVLLRLHEKYNIWVGPGGHIELNEDPVTAAIRECKEEVGLDVTIYDKHMTFKKDTPEFRELIPPNHLNIHRINDNHKHISFIYYGSSETDKVVPEDPSDKWLWLTNEEIDAQKDIKDDVKVYAKEAIKFLSE